MPAFRGGKIAVSIAIALTSVWLTGGAARTQSVEDFYKGHTLSIVVGFSAANAYDHYARALGRHIGRHIPGRPAVVILNRPGAGSLAAANYLYGVAPKDGSTIGIFNRSVAVEPLLGNSGSKFDPRKFNWLGSVGNEVSLCIAWHTAAVKTWHDLMTKEFVAASAGLSADSGVFPTLIKNLFGARIKIIPGYPGGAEMSKAIESGEADGRCGWSWSGVKATKPNWLQQKSINLLVQLGLQKSDELPDVPLIMDFARSDEERQILKLVFSRQEFAWPFVAPPDIPDDRLRALRAAFDATMKDPEFLEDAKRTALDVSPVSAADVHKLIEELYTTPDELIAKVRRLTTAQ